MNFGGLQDGLLYIFQLITYHTSAASSGSLVVRLPTLHHEPPFRQETQFPLGNVRKGCLRVKLLHFGGLQDGLLYLFPLITHHTSAASSGSLVARLLTLHHEPPVRQETQFPLGNARIGCLRVNLLHRWPT